MELILSIGLLTAVIMIADVSLAIQGNWPKILRVTLAAATYVAILGMTLKLTGRFGAPPSRLPVWTFLVAGAAGGLVSGVVRPEVSAPVVIVSAVLTPTLLGTFHWIALRRWSWIRARLARRG